MKIRPASFQLLNSRMKPTPHSDSERVESGHSPLGSITHAAVEATDALLHVSHLEHSHQQAGGGLRFGVGAMALARGGQALLKNEGTHAKLEGVASLGLGVSSLASLSHSHTVSNLGQGVRGAAEVALGAYQIWGHGHRGEAHEAREVAKGVLNCVKGATTFLPMVAHQTAAAVGVLHLGIVGANLALELS